MKIAKFFAGIFGAIGTLLLVGSIGLCLFSLNAPVKMEEIPAGAVECADAFGDAISQKDYDALESRIYGCPELGLTGEPADELIKLAWDLVQLNLEFSWQGDCRLQDGVLFREAQVRYLDAASIASNLQTRAHALLTQQVEEATDMEQLYAEGGSFREDLLDEVLKAALTQGCMEDVQSVETVVTVKFVCRDGQWWAVPDGALLTALSGGLA
jgi:hypothetical protein